MDFRRWLVVGLCFCVFTGCKSAQSYYDYCGPLPDEGGDFMYRKNSILGGDPAMTSVDDLAPGEQREPDGETGPEPTPAPPPDGEPRPGNIEDTSPELDDSADAMGDEELDEVADEELDSDSEGELGEVQGDVKDEVASRTDWHAPSKSQPSPVRQVRFRAK